MASKRKKTSVKVKKTTRKASRAEEKIGALRAISLKLVKHILVTEYLLEVMLTNDMVNETPDHADKIAALVAQMHGNPFAKDKESQQLVRNFAAKALARSKAMRETMQ